MNCQNVGGKLVKIETDKENDFIKNEYLNTKDMYWIGLSDIDKEGEWKWTDGTGLTGYKKWKSGQPNNKGHQDCEAILGGDYNVGHHNAEWNDLKCSKQLGYICKKSPGEKWSCMISFGPIKLALWEQERSAPAESYCKYFKYISTETIIFLFVLLLLWIRIFASSFVDQLCFWS